jgi:hypothetical protein
MEKDKLHISNKKLAYNGAVTAVASVFIYSIIVMTYVISRSSAIIYSIMPAPERNTILWANGFSVAYSVVVFSLLMAAVSSVAGAVSALVLKKALAHFNPAFNPVKAVIISVTAALAMLLLLYLLLYALLKEKITFGYAETFSFWFLFPAIIFLVVCIIGGSKLNKILGEGRLFLKNMKEDKQPL